MHDETSQPGLRAPDVGRPAITLDEAAAAARDLFGVGGELAELGSQQDRNYRIDDDGRRLLLKIANPAWSAAALHAQNAAIAHLAQAGLPVPQVLVANDGSTIAWRDVAGRQLAVRLLTFLDGTPLNEAGYLAPPIVRQIGTLAGRLSHALADFGHEGLAGPVQWDLQHAEEIVARFGRYVDDPAARTSVEQATADAVARLAPLRDSLPRQALHGDLTDDNLVCRRAADGRLEPCGIIDFGDVMRSWRVAELAVTCAAILSHMPENPLGVLPAVQAFDGLVRLDDGEIAALWPLITLRATALAVSDAQQLAVDPENGYTADRAFVGWQALEGAQRVGFELAEAAIRDALGRPEPAIDLLVEHHLLPGLAAGDPRSIDLSVTSEQLDEGRFLDPACEQELFAQAALRYGAAIARYGEHRLTRSRPLRADEPATYALCVEVVCRVEQTAHAPWPATVTETAGERLVLEHATDGMSVHLDGIATRLEAGSLVAAGVVVGTLPAGARLSLQLCLAPDVTPPAFVPASAAAAWRRLCPDPSPLLGIDCAAPPLDASAVLARRDSAYALVQGRYYEEPPQIERGHAEHLVDARGRTYVDMVNNVALLGHAHPEMTRAVTRQWHLLNTNSRFNYEVIAEFTTRLAALAPDGLDTVMLVNSGTEATDLALRIAFAHTGREIVVAVGEAYHGWSVASDAVSTSLADNPNALDTRPPWTRFLDSPNSYRGRHRGEAAGEYAWDAV
ncbi:MAG TPA: aminotransferase class III-fold pyridoxal phosphate-dependent enzyme, partial [Gaiellales bacterium]